MNVLSTFVTNQTFIRVVAKGLTLVLALIVTFSWHSNVQGQSCPITSTLTGSIAAGDATQTGRLTRDGVPSDCNGKASPGLFDSNPGRRFDQFSLVNTNGSPICVQVTLNGNIAGLHSTAYLTSYNPADVEQNYIGDLGVLYAANTNASYSFLVPAGATFVVVVHETTANGPTANYTLNLSCGAIPPPQPTAGQVLISEFRIAGPGTSGAGTVKDEYFELYNNTDGPLTIGNYRLGAFDPNFFGPADGADFFFAIPAGAVIPARGHYLIADTSTEVESYSLTAYAAPDAPITCGAGCDFYIDNEGIQLQTPAAAATQLVIDSVGFSGSGGRPGEDIDYVEGTPLPRRTQTPPTTQYAYVRKQLTGLPQDTNNNAADFQLVAVNGTTFPLAAGGNTPSRLGAPGPEDVASEVHNTTSSVTMPVFDNSATAGSAPNFVFDPTPVANGTAGSVTVRRRLVNNTGAPITQIRLRFVDITGFPAVAGSADLRVLSSGNLTLQQAPPAQAIGGGLNSSVLTLGTPIPNGANVPIDFRFGVMQTGCFHFIVIAEALPGGANTVFGFGGTAGSGVCAPTAAPVGISGNITGADGSPLAGVTMTLSGAKAARVITDASGNYRFTNVDVGGFYTVTPSLTNYHFGPESSSFSLLANKTDAGFSATRDAVGAGNAIDNPGYFVRQHYLDFLGREPDESGFGFWIDQLLQCGSDAACGERRMINVSAAYFLSIEFQRTGGLVDGLYRASYSRAPLYAEFVPDAGAVGAGLIVGEPNWPEVLDRNKQAFIESWVQRPAFRSAYDGLDNAAFVNTLVGHAGAGFNGDPAALINGLNSNTMTRAAVLRQIAENDGFAHAKSNRMFVMMQYFGYLKRDPDPNGYEFWLNKLNQFNGNFEQAEMVKAFIVSGEYRARFVH